MPTIIEAEHGMMETLAIMLLIIISFDKFSAPLRQIVYMKILNKKHTDIAFYIEVINKLTMSTVEGYMYPKNYRSIYCA